jgi:hypothetical protein
MNGETAMSVKSKYPQRTSAAPMTIEGTKFVCVKVGPLQTEWRSEDGKLRVARNYHSTTFTAYVNNGPILSDVSNDPVTKRFHTLAAAMSAAVRRARK